MPLKLAGVDLKYRRTRIVATLGPASTSPAILRKLIAAGVDVFRLNFSHGTHASHGETYAAVREAAAEAGRPIAVLADLCGPKIRAGRFPGGAIELETGGTVTVTVRDVPGEAGLIPSEYAALADDVRPGDRILLDDGKLALRVEAVDGTDVRCTVTQGGRLSDKKGINLPGVALSTPSLTAKDKQDAAFAASLGVDWIALSFVRAGSDLDELRAFCAARGAEIPLIAKIEKPEAIERIGEILEAADGLMIARGDLRVEMPAEEVPLLQEELIRVAVEACKPVIVATQMLESMLSNARPTRAEVTDVATAALAGADAVMLSGETAAGAFPVEAVAAMDRILRRIEGYQWRHGQFEGVRSRSEPSLDPEAPAALTRALSRATFKLARDLQVRAIVVPTFSGRTARTVVGVRPAAPVVMASADAALCRRFALSWGLIPREVGNDALARPARLARELVQQLGIAGPGQLILLIWDARQDEADEGAPTVSILRT